MLNVRDWYSAAAMWRNKHEGKGHIGSPEHTNVRICHYTYGCIIRFFNGNVEFTEFSRQKWESVITFDLKVLCDVRVFVPLGHLIPNKKIIKVKSHWSFFQSLKFLHYGSSSFTWNTGAPQGFASAHFLFTLYTHWISRLYFYNIPANVRLLDQTGSGQKKRGPICCSSVLQIDGVIDLLALSK